ncbi:MAG: helix-turn-helix transcriptional regulator, partial [Sphingopyxis sp.]|nr:helix-turn-helix transcriptional regulator [Sphingopyxis sp.]
AACDRIEIELPHAGDITAVVIWASGRLFGCQFEGPVSPATLSAVELKSAVAPTPEPTPAIAAPPGMDEVDADPASDEAFGDRLQRLRTSAGLSLAEVAKRMGVSAPSVSGWEKGRARPTRGRVVKLAAILRVPTSDLLDHAAPEEFQELVDRSREQIAHAAGVSPDRVRITIDY